MYYIIQENLFREKHYDMLIGVMQKFDLKYQIVKIIPFTTEILFEPIETKNVFVFGSLKMAYIAKLYNWTPGSFMNDNMDFRVYSQFYKDELLNYDSKVIKFGDEFEFPDYLFFARPCEDTKTFNGGVFTMESWKEMVAQVLKSGVTTGFEKTINENTSVQISSRKDIYREIRCWIVNNKVVTASQYKIGTRVVYQECTEPDIIEYVEKMSNIYSPAPAYVMDIALTDSGKKIIEIGCINCAGFYEANLQKLIEVLENSFNEDFI